MVVVSTEGPGSGQADGGDWEQVSGAMYAGRDSPPSLPPPCEPQELWGMVKGYTESGLPSCRAPRDPIPIPAMCTGTTGRIKSWT